MTLGRTGLRITRTGFGALPIQRISFDDAKCILRKAYDNGIDFFDTARSYSNSEQKIGYALSDVRKDIIIATKSPGKNRKEVLRDVETSLKMLKTDYVDILQLHNPSELSSPDDPESAFAGLMEAKERGMARFVGLTNHRLPLTIEAAKSGLYDTIQFPLSAISTDEDLDLIRLCKDLDLGIIAMKALCGGLLTNAVTAFAFLRQFENLVPIWGIQRESELDEFLALENNPPVMDENIKGLIDKDRRDLQGDFCRGCGYCLPCPADIPIPMAARMSFLLRRSPYQKFLEDDWKEKMQRIENCIECGACASRCPYSLDTPNLLKEMLTDYKQFYNQHR